MIKINLADIVDIQTCADCGTPIGYDDGPPDGWQLEDGRTVCKKCCFEDTKRFIDFVIELKRVRSTQEIQARAICEV